MKVLLVFLMLAAGALASCDKDPEGTNEKLYVASCKPGQPLLVNSIAVNNNDGSTDYPINVDATLNIILNLTNTGGKPFDAMTLSAGIDRYTDIFGICSWIGIPTFDLTNNLSACDFGDSNICPLKTGTTIVKDVIDLSAFKAIISILSASEPYRLTLTFKSNGQEIACYTVEARIVKG
uniref:MD-2-related lipid-recognition domain-containing protein n=1 Tax=Plectus sambesii TaxID=2011161 RepID=A0A914V970_9BILA